MILFPINIASADMIFDLSLLKDTIIKFKYTLACIKATPSSILVSERDFQKVRVESKSMRLKGLKKNTKIIESMRKELMEQC